MFATLLGALPHPPLSPDSDPAAIARAAIAAQVEAGLEPVTDGAGPLDSGGGQHASGAVEAWRATAAAAAPTAVKQALVGPLTGAGRAGDGSAGGAGAAGAVMALAESTGREIAALAAAGCPLIEVHEPSVVGRPFEIADRRVAIDAWRRLLEVAGEAIHVSLVLSGGDVTGLGAAIYEAPFASYGFDLRAGPDNWRVIADAPGDRGIVVGALATAAGSDDGPELLVWAAHYAASMRGRGLDRVGLATAGSLEHLPWESAVKKLNRLGEAARIAAHRTFAEIAPHLDPRAVGMKSAALGRYVPPRKRRS